MQSYAANLQGKPIFDIQQIEVGSNFLNSHVNCVYQDSKGFIWLGSDNGLCRYDGNNIITFTTTNSDIPFNNIHRVVEDDQGFLWIQSTVYKYGVEKIVLLDINTLQFEILDQEIKEQLIKSFAIKQGKDKTLFFINKEGEIEFEYESGFFLHVDDQSVSSLKNHNFENLYPLFKEKLDKGLSNVAFFLNEISGDLLGMDSEGNIIVSYNHLYSSDEKVAVLSVLRKINSKGEVFIIENMAEKEASLSSDFYKVHYNPKTGKFLVFWWQPADSIQPRNQIFS